MDRRDGLHRQGLRDFNWSLLDNLRDLALGDGRQHDLRLKNLLEKLHQLLHLGYGLRDLLNLSIVTAGRVLRPKEAPRAAEVAANAEFHPKLLRDRWARGPWRVGST